MTAIPTIPLTWRERAFDGPCRRTLIVRDGERWPTVAEIVASLQDARAGAAPGLPAQFVAGGEVRINGDLVPRGCWHLVRPRLVPGREVAVTLHMPLRGGDGGGDGGGKSTLALVATIAVLLAAAAVSGGALVPLLGSAFATGGIGATIASTAITVGGALAIAALTPPPSLPSEGAAAGAGVPDLTGKPVSLSGNVLAPGASLPRVVGTRRVFPPLLCEPLVELIGDREYGEVVFGLAGPHAIADVRVGNVPVDEIEEVVIEVQEGLQTSPIQSLVTRQGKTQQVAIELSRHVMAANADVALRDQADPAIDLPRWHRVVTRNAPDEVWLTLAWPEGLFNELAPTNTWQQPVRVRLRARGDVAWIDCPEIHFSFNQPTPFQRVIRIAWRTPPSPLAAPPSARGPIYAYKQVPAQTASPAGAVWDAHTSFSAGAGGNLLSAATAATTNVRNVELYQDKAVIYLDPGTFPSDVYEIEIKLGQTVDPSVFTAATYVFGAAVIDLFGYRLVGATAGVVNRKGDVHDRAVVTRAASVWNDNPIQAADDFATIAVRVHSRSLDQLSCLAAGYVLDWDGAAWATLATTSNPASHFRDVLAGTLAADPLPAVMIDDAGLVAWRTHCIAQSYTCDAVVDGRAARDVLTLVAASGYARPRMSETWGVLIDKDRSAEAPVQIFSARNALGFRFERAFAARPTGFRVRFDDAADDYRETAIIVDDPDAAPDAVFKLEEIRYDGLVAAADATARALFDLGQAAKRMTFYSATVPVEALVCQRGDLVGVQHDVLADQAGFTRIKSVLKAGGTVTGLTFDGSIPVRTKPGIFATAHLFLEPSIFDLGSRTGIAVRLADQSSIIKEVTAAEEETRQVSFVTPFADPGSAVLMADCLVTAGRLGSEYARMLVLDVAPQVDLTAQVTFVPEAPELWS